MRKNIFHILFIKRVIPVCWLCSKRDVYV